MNRAYPLAARRASFRPTPIERGNLLSIRTRRRARHVVTSRNGTRNDPSTDGVGCERGHQHVAASND
jgi:hypothetical protein